MFSSETFSHPGEHTFEECDRKFTTSNFATGDVLFYDRDKPFHGIIINPSLSIASENLKKVCVPCPKFEGCLVHETLLNVLNFGNNYKQAK